MSIELLNKEQLSIFKNSIDDSKKYIRVVSSFTGFETAKQMSKLPYFCNIQNFCINKSKCLAYRAFIIYFQII